MTDKNRLMRQIMEYGFAAEETALYLDTHPNDKDALSAIKKYTDKKNELTAVYEKQYGPLTRRSAADGNAKKWCWINAPWPWEGDND